MSVFLINGPKSLGSAPNLSPKIRILLKFRPKNLDPPQNSTPKNVTCPRYVPYWKVLPPENNAVLFHEIWPSKKIHIKLITSKIMTSLYWDLCRLSKYTQHKSMKNTNSSVINGHIIVKFCTRVAYDRTIPYTKQNSEIYTNVTGNDAILLKFERFRRKALTFKRLYLRSLLWNMAKFGRVTVDSISEVRIDKKYFLNKLIFDSPYFEPLPRQHQLRHELKNFLKTCTNTKCKKSASFNYIALTV